MRDGARTARGEFPPHVLRDYAFLGDGERGALIGPRGDVAWMCAPRWDSGAVFAALLGGAGAYTITPSATFVWGGYYEPGGLIWRSRWVTRSGAVECREALAFPGDPDRVVLLRRVIAVDADAQLDVALDLCDDFAPQQLRDLRCSNGVWTARSGEAHLRWSGAGDAWPVGDGDALGLRLQVPTGQHHDLVLEISDRPIGGEPPRPDTAWEATEQAWRSCVPDLQHCAAPLDTQHSYAVLRGLTSASGGMVAAATTSLPERSGAGRNYDYRYAWIRDQCFAGHAVAAAAGGQPLLDDAVRFVSARLLEDGDRLAPAYTVAGGRVPDESHLHLPGYPGGSDVSGNHANDQFQLDAFGESLLLFSAAAAHDRLDDDGRAAAQVAARAIGERWQETDAGIWEIEPKAWTHSRLICAAGLRAADAADLAGGRDLLGLARRVEEHTAARATHPSGRWQRAPDDPGNDAALLLPAIRDADLADDERSLRTVRSYLEDLTHDGYAYRFRHDDRPLHEAEGSFLLCGFMVALAHHRAGDRTEAFRWFERTRAACGPPVLYTEEFDVHQHQLRGNIPQAFVHALMVECSAVLAR